jgi:hypothetical protein
VRAASLLALITACGPPPVMLVTDVRIEGRDLVLKKCPVTSGDMGRSFDAWRSCQTKRLRLPVVASDADRTPIPIPTPDREAIYRRIGRARSALRSCAEAASLRGEVAVALTVDGAGRVSSVEPAALAVCVREALGDAPFSVSLSSTQLTFSIRNVEPEASP